MCEHCSHSRRLREAGKIVTSATWDQTHATHGGFTFAPLEHAPKGYGSHWKVCACGARHLRPKDKDKHD